MRPERQSPQVKQVQDDGERGRALKPTSKWGRHRCRPHARWPCPDDGAIAVPFRPRRRDHCDALDTDQRRGTGGAAHRDAHRIGSDHPEPRPAATVSSATIGLLLRADSHRPACGWRPVPSGGRFRSEDLPLPPGGSVIAFEARFRFLPTACRSRPSSSSFGSFRNQSSGCAPFAASAVRQIPSEDFLRRVFRHCCGHRRRVATVVFSPLGSRFYPLLLRSVWPSR